MTSALPDAMLQYMPKTPSNHLLVLEEFRLHGAGSASQVERIVAMPRSGRESAIPLLTNIDDPRDVAMLHTTAGQDSNDADREERAALAPFVASRQPLKWYRLRVAENAQAAPRFYRMAVTESGINAVEVERDLLARPGPGSPAREAISPIGLLWIGAPVGTHAGLLVLIGHYGDGPFAVSGDIAGWPLSLSRKLGVRIYQGVESTIDSRGERTEGQIRAA